MSRPQLLLRRTRLPPLRRLNSTLSSASPDAPHSAPLDAFQIYASRLSLLLSQPTWSIRTHLPPETTPETANIITPAKLHHLLRLSALPPPETPEQESALLDALHRHLYFVKSIQEVDTTGVEPLARVEDEDPEGLKERVVTWDMVVGAEKEMEGVGPRGKAAEGWDAVGMAGKRVGAFYAVEEAVEEVEETTGAGGEGKAT